MTFLASISAAFIPMLFYLILLWRADKYERESFGNVFKHFLWGAFGAVILGIIFSFAFESTFSNFVVEASSLSVLSAVIIAPFVEEIAKGIYLIQSYRKNYFDDITDGLVYGGAIGLGFGMTENIIYFTQYGDTFTHWISLVFTRTIFSAVMHGITTATFGAFLAKSKFTLSVSRFIYPFIGLFIAMLIHFTWNLMVTYEYTAIIGILFMFFLIMIFFFVFRFSLNSERKLISTELSDEFSQFGAEKIFEGRKFNSFSNDVIQNKLFQNFATKLAFRKFQSRNTSGKLQKHYAHEVELYRDRLKILINKHITEKPW